MYRVALASTRDGLLYPGHFAHAEIFKIYVFDEEKGFKLEEDRENPLGQIPDMNAEEGDHRHHHEHHEHHHAVGPGNIPLHGRPKYMWLRENVLKDVDVILAVDACQTSYNVFTSQGAKMIFTDPAPVEALVKYVEGEGREEFKRILDELDEYSKSSES